MRKLSLTLLVIFGLTQMTFAQIDFGVKGGLNYNLDSFKSVKEDIISDFGKSSSGFHGGVWLRFNLGSLSARTELVYTQLKSDFKIAPDLISEKNTATFTYKKIDVPVLFEFNFLRLLYAYAGPSFQYALNSNVKIKDIVKDSDIANKFSVGLQTGLGVKFGKFGVDVRWERAFKDSEMKFLKKNIKASKDLKFDHRTNQIIVSASYCF